MWPTLLHVAVACDCTVGNRTRRGVEAHPIIHHSVLVVIVVRMGHFCRSLAICCDRSDIRWEGVTEIDAGKAADILRLRLII
jgi:hypothetical protein